MTVPPAEGGAAFTALTAWISVRGASCLRLGVATRPPRALALERPGGDDDDDSDGEWQPWQVTVDVAVLQRGPWTRYGVRCHRAQEVRDERG